MRRVFFATVVPLSLAALATAQTKITGTAQCAKPDPMHSIGVGDRPNHSYMISQFKCTWTKPIDYGVTQNKEGTSTQFDEVTGDSSRSHGLFVDAMANGDKLHVTYQSKATLKEGMPQTIASTWAFASGTGKLKGIKGKGTAKGTGNADGTVTYEIEGEFSLPTK